jgi:hypothetical protein
MALACLVGACEKPGIEAYRAPRQTVTPGPEPAAEAQQPSPITWTVPDGWVKVASDQAMRLATFHPGPGLPEVSLNAFPGDTGGLLANVNRWRGQLGLPPIEEADLASAAPTETVEGVSISIVDLTGSTGQEMLGAVIVPGDGQTWFAKATGDPAPIAALKPAFVEFARSFRMTGQASPPPGPAPTPAEPARGVEGRLAAWKPPEHWRVDAGASSIVAAGYDAPNAEGGAKITATMLRNDGGGPLANINRWRGQLGLPPVDRLDQQPTTDLGGGNLVVDLAAADGRRMIAAIVASPSETWFFKMTGATAAVEAERPGYDHMVRYVGLGEGAP